MWLLDGENELGIFIWTINQAKLYNLNKLETEHNLLNGWHILGVNKHLNTLQQCNL
jgi:hypothetical protein